MLTAPDDLYGKVVILNDEALHRNALHYACRVSFYHSLSRLLAHSCRGYGCCYSQPFVCRPFLLNAGQFPPMVERIAIDRNQYRLLWRSVLLELVMKRWSSDYLNFHRQERHLSQVLALTVSASMMACHCWIPCYLLDGLPL